MDLGRNLPRNARWAVPGVALAAVAAVIAGSMLAAAPAAPRLAGRSTVQLLADINSATAGPPAMTAVISQSAALGFPDLPGAGDRLSGLSWLSGSHTVKIWYADPAHLRVAVPVQLGETDVRRDGSSVWFWDSQTSQATHLVLPAQTGGAGRPGPVTGAETITSAPSPQQVARQVLAAVGPTTTVSLQQNVMIAGQASYQISLAPKDSRSLIGQVRIAVDARHYLPLRVQVFARAAAGPAFQVGYTSLQFGAPAAANFTFTPPSGAKVKTIKVPDGKQLSMLGNNGGGLIPGGPIDSNGSGFVPGIGALQAALGGAASPLPVSGTSASGMSLSRAVLRRMRRTVIASMPKSMSAAQRKAALKQFDMAAAAAPNGAAVSVSNGAVINAPSAAGLGALGGSPAGTRAVLGTGWLSVVMIPADGQSLAGMVAAAGGRPRAAMIGQPAGAPPAGAPPVGAPPVGAPPVGAPPVGASAAYSSQLVVVGPPRIGSPADVPASARRDLAVAGALLRAATPVHGSWGSGRLLTTSLLSVLVLSDGRLLIGAVTPDVLYADAAHLR